MSAGYVGGFFFYFSHIFAIYIFFIRHVAMLPFAKSPLNKCSWFFDCCFFFNFLARGLVAKCCSYCCICGVAIQSIFNKLWKYRFDLPAKRFAFFFYCVALFNDSLSILSDYSGYSWCIWPKVFRFPTDQLYYATHSLSIWERYLRLSFIRNDPSWIYDAVYTRPQSIPIKYPLKLLSVRLPLQFNCHKIVHKSCN